MRSNTLTIPNRSTYSPVEQSDPAIPKPKKEKRLKTLFKSFAFITVPLTSEIPPSPTSPSFSPMSPTFNNPRRPADNSPRPSTSGDNSPRASTFNSSPLSPTFSRASSPLRPTFSRTSTFTGPSPLSPLSPTFSASSRASTFSSNSRTSTFSSRSRVAIFNSPPVTPTLNSSRSMTFKPENVERW